MKETVDRLWGDHTDDDDDDDDGDDDDDDPKGSQYISIFSLKLVCQSQK